MVTRKSATAARNKSYSGVPRNGSGRPDSSQGMPGNGASNRVNPTSRVDFNKDKEVAIAQINLEIKKYDLNDMKTDINYKMSAIVNNLKKSEK